MKWYFIGILIAGLFISLRAVPLPLPSGALASDTFQVSSSNDDVNEDGTFYTADSSLDWIGTGDSTTSSFSGFRFTNVAIPPHATINSAALKVYSAFSQRITVQLIFAADLASNSPAFSASDRPSQRSLTTEKVSHSSDSQWEADTWYTLDEIAPVIQEVVNQPGWSSGNSISIILKGSGSRWGRKFIRSWDGSTSNAPQLVVSYTSNSTATATSTGTDASSPTQTGTPALTSTSTPTGASQTSTFTPIATGASTTPTFTPTATTSSPGSSSSITTFSIGPGWADAIPHQIVRASDDRVYFFGNTGDYSNHLISYWTGAPGLPAKGSDFSGTTQITENADILATDAVYDGGQFIHVITLTNDGLIKDRPFDISTRTFRAAKTIDNSGGKVSGNYVGTSGISGMVDKTGRLNLAYWTASNHILYRAYTYDGAADALSLADGPTQLDASGSSNHPSLAVNPLDGSITVAWISQAAIPAQILAKTKAGSTWGGVETVSSAPVWTSTDFGINIDQGPSLLITSDGVRRLAYIENWRISVPYDYGRIHYAVSSSGSAWSDQYIGSYTHDPVLATNSLGEIYILGHGYALNSVCNDNLDVCAYKRNADGSWATPQVILKHQGSQGFDSSPSVKWSVVGQNRPGSIEFLIADSGAGYTNTTLYYGRIDSSSTGSGGTPAKPPPATSTPAPQASATPTATPTGTPSGLPPAGPIQFVQSQLAFSSSFVPIQAVTLPQAVTSGHTLVVAVSAYASGSVSSILGITDSAGNTYTRAVQEPNPAQGSHNLSLWVAQSITGSPNLTVTAFAPPGSSEFITLAVHEYTAGTVDQTVHSNGTSQLATSGTTPPTTQNQELVFGAFLHESPSDSSPSSSTPGTGFTLRQNLYDGTYEPLVSEDENVGQINAYSANLTWNTSVTWRSVALTLKP